MAIIDLEGDASQDKENIVYEDNDLVLRMLLVHARGCSRILVGMLLQQVP
jgi:hypothetical protein